MRVQYRHIFQIVEHLSGEDNYVAIHNIRRKFGNRCRKYKYNEKRRIRVVRIMMYLYKLNLAEPDLTRAQTWGAFPEEDGTIDQEREWPFK